MTSHGGARTRGLAAELKQLRLAAGLTLQEVADLVDIHISTLSRAETGVRSLSPEDTAAVLTAYRVSKSDRARLMRLTRQANRPEWWEPSADDSKHLATLAHLEASATHITHSAMLRIPGLLQVADYARTIMLEGGIEPAIVGSHVEARLKRQAVLGKRAAPDYLAILDEMAVRRVVGSRSVMVQQVNHLIEAAGRPHVELRVVPFSHGNHLGLESSFVMMRFANAQPTLYFEHPCSSLFVDGQEAIGTYQALTRRMLQVAWSTADSVKFLRRLAAEFAGGEKSGSS